MHTHAHRFTHTHTQERDTETDTQRETQGQRYLYTHPDKSVYHSGMSDMINTVKSRKTWTMDY